jgi:hypothetical protein
MKTRSGFRRDAVFLLARLADCGEKPSVFPKREFPPVICGFKKKLGLKHTATAALSGMRPTYVQIVLCCAG